MRFAGAARRVRHRADPNAVHDVRVAARQLEAALDLWRGELRRRHARRARRVLRELRRCLAATREAQASIAVLNERLEHLSLDTRGVALQVIASAKRQSERLDARAAKLCARRKTNRILRQIERAWPGSEAASPPSSSCLERAGARIDVRRARAEAALQEALADVTDDALHAARVAVKRWRYSMERFAVVALETSDPRRKGLKSIQEALGRIQDLRVLRESILRSIAELELSDRAALPGLLGVLKHLEAERSGCVADFRRVVASAAAVREPLIEFSAPCVPFSRTRS